MLREPLEGNRTNKSRGWDVLQERGRERIGRLKQEIYCDGAATNERC